MSTRNDSATTVTEQWPSKCSTQIKYNTYSMVNIWAGRYIIRYNSVYDLNYCGTNISRMAAWKGNVFFVFADNHLVIYMSYISNAFVYCMDVQNMNCSCMSVRWLLCMCMHAIASVHVPIISVLCSKSRMAHTSNAAVKNQGGRESIGRSALRWYNGGLMMMTTAKLACENNAMCTWNYRIKPERELVFH